jgi:hypothetical protein
MQDVEIVLEAVARGFKTLGYRCVEDVRHPEAFGSRYAVFSKKSSRSLRLVWDGKEEWFLLQQSSAGNWHDLAEERTGSRIDLPRVIESLSQSIDRHVRGASA